MSIKHVLFILTNAAEIGPNKRSTGYFFPEVAHPYEVFAEAGVSVEYASLKGGAIPEDGYDENDPSQRAFRNSAAYRRLNRSRKLSEVDVLDYDAIFFPGGLGPMVDIANNPEVQQAVERAWNGWKIVAAVCHGPAALPGAEVEDGTPLIKGRKRASFADDGEPGSGTAVGPFNLEDRLRAACRGL